MNEIYKIELEDGKYTFLHNEIHGGITILRHGEPWRNETGDNALLSLIYYIKELEKIADKYDNLIDTLSDMPIDINDLLED